MVVIKIRCIVRVRIYVERVIGCLKCFNIL